MPLASEALCMVCEGECAAQAVALTRRLFSWQSICWLTWVEGRAAPAGGWTHQSQPHPPHTTPRAAGTSAAQSCGPPSCPSQTAVAQPPPSGSSPSCDDRTQEPIRHKRAATYSAQSLPRAEECSWRLHGLQASVGAAGQHRTRNVGVSNSGHTAPWARHHQVHPLPPQLCEAFAAARLRPEDTTLS